MTELMKQLHQWAIEGLVTGNPCHNHHRKETKMQEIITEILERLGFPTKGLEDFDVFKKRLSREKMNSLSIVTLEGRVIGYYIIGETRGIKHLKYIGGSLHTYHANIKPKVCSLGSELVARLKSGE